MSELWLLSEAQMRRIEPHFLLSHGILRFDDRRIGSDNGTELDTRNNRDFCSAITGFVFGGSSVGI